MNHERALLLSLHPRFANAILDGSKTVEIRRQRVAVLPGTPVILYATSPVMALVGTAQVSAVHVAQPDEVWNAHSAHTALSREEFDKYTDGTRHTSAVVLHHVAQLSQQVPLSHLRAQGGFHPPQSYCYLSEQALRDLLAGHPMASAVVTRLKGRLAGGSPQQRGNTERTGSAMTVAQTAIRSHTRLRTA